MSKEQQLKNIKAEIKKYLDKYGSIENVAIEDLPTLNKLLYIYICLKEKIDKENNILPIIKPIPQQKTGLGCFTALLLSFFIRYTKTNMYEQLALLYLFDDDVLTNLVFLIEMNKDKMEKAKDLYYNELLDYEVINEKINKDKLEIIDNIMAIRYIALESDNRKGRQSKGFKYNAKK